MGRTSSRANITREKIVVIEGTANPSSELEYGKKVSCLLTDRVAKLIESGCVRVISSEEIPPPEPDEPESPPAE